jgi:hypothetical protein
MCACLAGKLEGKVRTGALLEAGNAAPQNASVLRYKHMSYGVFKQTTTQVLTTSHVSVHIKYITIQAYIHTL